MGSTIATTFPYFAFLTSQARSEITTSGIVLVLLSCVNGLAISYAGLRVQQLVTATTFMVLTNVNKFAVILFGVVVLHDEYEPLGVSIPCICTSPPPSLVPVLVRTGFPSCPPLALRSLWVAGCGMARRARACRSLRHRRPRLAPRRAARQRCFH